MKQTYDVFDKGIMIIHEATSSEISRKIGIKSRAVAKYCDNGYAYAKRYTIDKVKEIERSRNNTLLNVYDLTEGDYILSEVEKTEVCEKYNLKVNTVDQYVSSVKPIKNRYLVFRVGELPLIMVPDEISNDWDKERFRLNPRARERVS